ncbi:SDR family NAD(P)-dependent oxidoreductase [Amycolatopsis rhabdoformis]|uniref:SDR family NAD(P)-dependent oxidoreductase n=1 Tax=Amycolatopsis rhabdoformis TaxID=1448059 RepID=A0ABZ1HZI5_9PSEU|nr:SDR family NAD(P)-dependent oxidoreductase [Amycolatopsis rhabdoformis]WSE27036.1 SDR family NAD(P)-dependent oxidoreductase [Amycolatopsis rhabdoformis]
MARSVTERWTKAQNHPAARLQSRLHVTSPADIEAAAQRLETHHGKLDLLVNNAGARFSAEPAELTAEHLRGAFETNLFGAAALTHRLPGCCAPRTRRTS